MGGRGGIGRRSGLKIRFPKGVRVQVPPSAPSARHRLLTIAAAVLATSALTGCSLWQDDGPVRVVALGTLHRDPARMPMPRSMPDRLFLDATGQSLVSLSADGQVEAGLAERWTVIDNGRSYIFRLREARWADGRRVRSADVAAILRARVGASRLPPQLLRRAGRSGS